MFGALNRFISRLDSDPSIQQRESEGPVGFHVLRNSRPEVEIEPWFDFIVGINGRQIDNPSAELFATEVRNSAGATISLTIYSAKGQTYRETYVQVPVDTKLLGLSLDWEPVSVTEDVWHILDVTPNSPAEVAGLLPYSDYVIGSPDGLMQGEGGLGHIIEQFLENPLRLYVYNQEYDVVRQVTITPTRNWGGNGMLGCVLGFGALHRIPAPLDSPAQAPGETMFEASQMGNGPDNPAKSSEGLPSDGAGSNLVTPADMLAASAGGSSPGEKAPGPPKNTRKARANHHVFSSNAMDDYFKEEEEKNREDSPRPAASGQGSFLPPPPKQTAGS